ncbi:MAG: putative restriction endonuclease [Arcticibacterium sp.]|jgi:putative restriction endonuclease
MISLDHIEEILVELNASERHETKYAIQYFLPCIKQYIYMNKQAGSKASGLVIHPRFENKVDKLLAVNGVESTGTLNHKSSMRKFPKRIHGGKQPIPFGVPFGFQTKDAMRAFINELTATKPYYSRIPEKEILDAKDRGDFSGLNETEVEVITLSRRGQGAFRKGLIKLWGKCSVTGCGQVEILKASHIKPWRDSSNSERLDPHNGLLLTPNLDTLFDIGMITFSADGSIIISKVLSTKTLEALNTDVTERLSTISSKNKKYLKYHREFIFQDE